MRTQRRSLFKLFLFAGLFTALVAAYLHFGLFPGRLKTYTIQKIEELTRARVEFDKALYLPFRGLRFESLKVRDSQNHLLFAAKSLAVDAKFIPFFREKKIVIRNVYLDSPVYDFALKPRRAAAPPPPKTKLGEIEVPVVPETRKLDLAALGEGPDAFLPENVYLEQIQIVDGLVRVRESESGALLEEIGSINVRMGFHKPPKLTFDGSLRLGQTPYSFISLGGEWNLDRSEYEFLFQVRSQKVPAWLLEYQKKNFLILKNGGFGLSLQMKSLGEDKVLFHAKAELENAALAVRQTVYSGRMRVEAKGVFDFFNRRFERYKGTLGVVKADIANLSEQIPRLDDISGEVRFQPDLLEIASIRGEFKEVPFEAQGTVKSFRDPAADIRIRMDADLGQILSLLPDDQKKWIRGYILGGACQALTTMQGSLKKSARLKTEYRLVLRDGSLTSPDQKIDLSQMSGEVVAGQTGTRIQNGRCVYLKKEYSFGAFIPKDPGLQGNIEVASEGWRIASDYLLDGETVLLRGARAEYEGMSADFGGRFLGLRNPYLDIQGHLVLRLPQLNAFLAAKNPSLKDLSLSGDAEGIFTLQGVWNDVKTWDLKADAKSARITAKKLQLEDVEMQVRMQGAHLDIPYLHAHLCGGSAGGKAAVELTKAAPFEAEFYVNNFDLQQLSQQLALKSSFTGNAILQARLRGQLASQDTYAGNGAFSIRGGKLFETSLFKAMGELVLVKVEGFDRVVFRDMSATFDVHDKRLWTQDLVLFSDYVDLALRGSAGFDQTLDFMMNIQFARNVLEGAFDTGGIAPFVIQEAGDFISEYRVSGTLSNPKYEKAGLGVGNAIGRKISNLFSNLAQ